MNTINCVHLSVMFGMTIEVRIAGAGQVRASIAVIGDYHDLHCFPPVVYNVG
ncbi:MAG TPA: hypothetical protein VH796_11720 [Nitrososphaeraceae archaeon]|jgi:hypothetical protein